MNVARMIRLFDPKLLEARAWACVLLGALTGALTAQTPSWLHLGPALLFVLAAAVGHRGAWGERILLGGVALGGVFVWGCLSPALWFFAAPGLVLLWWGGERLFHPLTPLLHGGVLALGLALIASLVMTIIGEDLGHGLTPGGSLPSADLLSSTVSGATLGLFLVVGSAPIHLGTVDAAVHRALDALSQSPHLSVREAAGHARSVLSGCREAFALLPASAKKRSLLDSAQSLSVELASLIAAHHRLEQLQRSAPPHAGEVPSTSNDEVLNEHREVLARLAAEDTEGRARLELAMERSSARILATLALLDRARHAAVASVRSEVQQQGVQAAFAARRFARVAELRTVEDDAQGHEAAQTEAAELARTL